MELSVNEIALIEAAIEFKTTLSRFLAFDEVTSVFYFVEIPAFGTKAVLLVIVPFSFIHTAVCIYEYTEAVCFPIFPFSLVYISIYVSHSSSSVVKAIKGLTFVNTSISELYYTETFPDI